MTKRIALHISTLFSFLLIGLPNLSFAAGSEELIEASGQYILGDNDSKLDGRRLALQEAKRNALEKAGTYIESFTEVKNFQLTQDQMRSYAAGILELKEAGEKWDKVGDNLAVTLTVKVKVDKEAVAKQIAAIRKNSETSQALEEAGRKIHEYEQRIAEMNQQLKMAKGPTTDAAKESRSKALTKIDAVALLAKARIALTGSDDPDKVLVFGSTSAEARSRASGFLLEASNLDPENLDVLESLSTLSFEEKDYRKAEMLNRKAISLDPTYPNAQVGLGTALWLQNDLAGAEQAIRHGIRLKPNYALAHHQLSMVLQTKGDFSGAVQASQEAVRLQPNESLFHNGLGGALYRQGNFVEAKKEWVTACRLGEPASCELATRARGLASGCATTASAADLNYVAAGETGIDAGLLVLLGAPLLLALRRLHSRTC